MISIRRTVPLVLAPIALCLAALRGFGTGPNPLADPGDDFGTSLAPFGDVIAGVWCLAVAAAIAAGGVANRRWVVVGAAVLALLTLDHSLLMLLGYLPMIAVRVVTGDTGGLGDLASPGLGLQLLVAAAGTSLLLGLRGRTAAGRGDPAALTARTRRWTLVAIEAPLAYAVTRLLMFAEAPGFRGFDQETRMAGLGLAVAAILGAVLTLGLIRPWGERFPRWMVGLAGRRVPPDLAVVPAMVIAGLILAASRAILVGAIDADAETWRELAETPLVSVPHLLWPLWGAALVLAAVSYHRRRTTAGIEGA